jgi:hypothetical protein
MAAPSIFFIIALIKICFNISHLRIISWTGLFNISLYAILICTSLFRKISLWLFKMICLVIQKRRKQLQADLLVTEATATERGVWSDFVNSVGDEKVHW